MLECRRERPAAMSVTPHGNSAVPVQATEGPPGTVQVRSETIDAAPGSTDAPPGTSTVPRGISYAPRETSEVPHGTSEVPHGTSEVPLRTSEVPLRTSEVPRGSSEVPGSSSLNWNASLWGAAIRISPISSRGEGPRAVASRSKLSDPGRFDENLFEIVECAEGPSPLASPVTLHRKGRLE